MSFQEGERPTRPVRARGPQQQDDQQILIRRLMAGGAAVLIVIILFIAIKGCLGSRKDSAYKSYATDVNALLASSNGESKAFYTALSTPPKTTANGGGSLDVQNIVNTQAADAQDLVNRAEKLDHPGQLDQANNWLVQTLKFRADALDQIANVLPAALADKNRKPAIDKIAAQNQALLTSDVIYSQRALPNLNSAFQDRNISRQFLRSNFLPIPLILTWLDPKGVETELNKVAGGAASDQSATTGLHGTGVSSVSVGDTELTEGEVNHVAAANPTFAVQVENQGDNEETQVAVTVTVTGAKPITADGTIPSIAAGETGTATIPLGQAPPTDGTSTVKVEVAPVPGEGTKENNTVQYEVAFTS